MQNEEWMVGWMVGWMDEWVGVQCLIWMEASTVMHTNV